MNKYFNILYLSIFITEFIISFIIIFFYSLDFKGSFDVVALWSVWRVLFYGLPFLFIYLYFFAYIMKVKIYKPFLFSFFNFFVYVLLSVLARIVLGENILLPPEAKMFWITCISIFLAPVVLGSVPYFKRLMSLF
jgi:hypothetical protein